MKQIVSFIKKEVFHILRDKRTLVILLIMPIVQIVLYGFALTNEVKNSKFAVIDQSQTPESQQLIQRLSASKYFDFYAQVNNENDIEKLFQQSKIKLGIVLDANFATAAAQNQVTYVQLITDGSDPNVGSTLTQYAMNIIQKEFAGENQIQQMQIKPTVRYLYNPQLLSSFNFVPGVMAMILMLVSTMMTAVAIVREKEMGTMEVMLVSPMQPLRLILAKMIPYFAVSFINVITIILMSVFVLHLPIKGNLAVLLLESSLFIVACLSFGFFISTVTDTQETAMFISLVGLFLPTLMLSGYMFPIENLPLPLRVISHAVPARWFYNILKAVMLKGLGFGAVWKENLILLGMITGLLVLSIKKFKLRLE